jgi:hypothetical protein
MMISITSRRASPGATTLACLLAAWWDEDGATRLLLEADESGGILAPRLKDPHGLTWQPGLIELATLPEPDLAGVLANSQPLNDLVQAVAAPPGSAQVINALNALGDEGASKLSAIDDLRAFVDCGRLTRSGGALHLARRSVVTIIVCRPELEEIHSMLAGVVELRDAGCHLGLVVSGDGPWPPTEIAERAQVPLLGVLPDDPKAARLLARDGLIRSRRLNRTALARAMDELVASLQSYCEARQRPVDEHDPGVSAPLAVNAQGGESGREIGPFDVGRWSGEAAAASSRNGVQQ